MLLSEQPKNGGTCWNGNVFGAVVAALQLRHIMVDEFNQLSSECRIGTDEEIIATSLIQLLECDSYNGQRKEYIIYVSEFH